MSAAQPLHQELRFARARSGARIAWARNGQGPPLLRAGHWMTHVEHDTTSALFRPWLERLGRGLSVHRFDERGFGLSTADDEPPGVAASLQDLVTVMDAAGLARCAVLGISGGAAAAIALAARHPERVSQLVLLGAFAQGPLVAPASAEQAAYLEAQAQLMALGWGVRNAPVQQFITASMLPDATPEQAAALNEQQRLSCDGRRAAAYFRSRLVLDVRAELAAVRCPTLVMHAEGDASVAAERGREIAAAIPGARFETLHTRNHVPVAGEPAFERFCTALTAFVRPVADSPGAAGFTPRQRQLLALVAQGRDNLQIAAELGLADKTVRNALSALYAQLGVEGRSHAVVRARELGF